MSDGIFVEQRDMEHRDEGIVVPMIDVQKCSALTLKRDSATSRDYKELNQRDYPRLARHLCQGSVRVKMR